MFDRLRSLTKTITGHGSFIGSVRDYPSYKAPYETGGALLGSEHLAVNLAHFLKSRPSRLNQVVSLLQSQGLEPELALSTGEDPVPFLDGLQSWATNHWGTGHVSKQCLVSRFWVQHRDDGSCPLYGFLEDVGLLLGEIVMAQRPGCSWCFDPKAKNREHSDHVNRILIGGLGLPTDETIPSYFDPGLSAFAALKTIRTGPNASLHGLTRNIRPMLTYYPELS